MVGFFSETAANALEELGQARPQSDAHRPFSRQRVDDSENGRHALFATLPISQPRE
jgi:hypothetical protein